MKRSFLRAVVVSVICAVPATGWADCAEYGALAAAQHQENTTLGCGFSGLRWHGDSASHAGFCGLVGESAAAGETDIREAALARCRPADLVQEQETPPSQCQRSEVAEGTGVGKNRARSIAQSELGRVRAEMANAGLTQCLYHDLGCTGATTGEANAWTCYLSVECCKR